MFDWKKLETEIEVVEEACIGLKDISNDMLLTLVSSLIFEMDFKISDVEARMASMVDAEYAVAKHDLMSRLNEDNYDQREDLDL